jgi:hypothetical protein
MSAVFNGDRRRKRRQREIEEAVERAASQRTNFMDALLEVLKATSELTLRCGRWKLRGGNGSCNVSTKWHDLDDFLYHIETLQKELGGRFDVVGRAWVEVAQMSFGAACDIASRSPNIRLHGGQYRTQMVEMRNHADAKQYRWELSRCKRWITITVKG